MTTWNDPILQCPVPRPMAMDPRWRANIDPAPSCPRCASANTKFCYYNNYSLSQPRFFCKGCRRYWTRGGSLRNVPVGGGCRKTRRSRSKALANSARGSDPSPNSSSDSGPDTNGHDIDMAAVFARYLSNDQNNNEMNELTTTTNTNTNTPEVSHDSLSSTSNHQQIEEEETFHEFVTSDFAGFDDIVDDVFWPQLQEFDSQLLTVDQSILKSTDSVLYENWGGFDNAVYEAFSRH